MDNDAAPRPSIRIDLSFFKDFPIVAGLVRDTGARRTGARTFVLDDDMAAEQVAALMRLVLYSRREPGDPVTVTVEPPLTAGAYGGASEELYAWWGTVENWR
ncbi:hypothetical protein AB0O20_27695 [Streptomyces kronopolitis]|uniref:hypothetical protein n=1 Tax=Streptomyces kronopolitis TaxID=1612435 RepID=UPI003419CA1E